MRESEGMDATRRIRPSKSTEQDSYEFTETGVACTGPAQVCGRSSVYISWLLVECFHGIPERVNEWDSDSWALSSALFLFVGL